MTVSVSPGDREVSALQAAEDRGEDREQQIEWLAHDLWSFGITTRHPGKCVADDESNYANRCEPCEANFMSAAASMVDEGWRKP